jgi:hypothetical protein
VARTGGFVSVNDKGRLTTNSFDKFATSYPNLIAPLAWFSRAAGRSGKGAPSTGASERPQLAQLFRPSYGSFVPDSGPSLAAPVDREAAQRAPLGRGLQRALNIDSRRPWRIDAAMVYIATNTPAGRGARASACAAKQSRISNQRIRVGANDAVVDGRNASTPAVRCAQIAVIARLRK